MKRVLKWNVPLDDQFHWIGSGPVVHVASQNPGSGSVQVWTEESADSGTDRKVTIFGTGHPIPNRLRHVGSSLDGPFVWHVYEDPTPGSDGAS